jgi:hypothetical protein
VGNDDVSDALDLGSLPFDAGQAMWAATSAADDPVFPCTGLAHSRTVWFTYTAPDDGVLHLSTEGSGYDTVLAIWEGSRGDLTNLGCHDDVVTGVQTTSRLATPIVAGATYLIEVAAYDIYGSGQLDLTADLGHFVDVVPTDWSYPYIEALADLGYVAGCSTDPPLYCPDTTLNRAQGAVFVDRGIHGAEYVPPAGTSTFGDVDSGFWGIDWIESLWDDGYTAGCSADPLRFCPLQLHTRAEGSVFFERMQHGKDYVPPTATGVFSDVDTSWWGAPWVEAAYADGLIEPCQTSPDLQFCPMDALDRATTAYMMVQAKDITLP